MADYSQMTNDEFHETLSEVVDDMSTASLLTVTGIYECLQEELNNEVLERWARQNPRKAWPAGRPEEDECDDSE